MHKVFFDDPSIGVEEKRALTEAVDSSYVSSAGKCIGEFEKAFANYLGVMEAAAVNSGTAALHSALYELGIGEGSEVIVPVLTFIATVNPVIYVGAKPVFVDVDERTWNIKPEFIEGAITDKTKAIIPVHLYGNPCAMVNICQLARDNNLVVIEDATESLGASYNGQMTGTFGDMGCFSFNGNKIITTGSGGMVVGQDVNRLKHIRFLCNQAKDSSKVFYHSEVGFNYRMTNIEAALGMAQLKKLLLFLEKKRKISEIYRDCFAQCEHIDFQESYKEGLSSYWITPILFKEDIDIEGMQNALAQMGVPTRRVFRPLTESDPYRSMSDPQHKNAYSIYQRGLCLPNSVLNSYEGIEYVAENLKKIHEKFLKNVRSA